MFLTRLHAAESATKKSSPRQSESPFLLSPSLDETKELSRRQEGVREGEKRLAVACVSFALPRP